MLPFPQPCADMKMHLSSTDYGSFLQNEPSPVSTSTLAQKCTEKLVHEFNFLRDQAVQPLATFLEYVTCALVSLEPLRSCVSHLEFESDCARRVSIAMAT